MVDENVKYRPENSNEIHVSWNNKGKMNTNKLRVTTLQDIDQNKPKEENRKLAAFKRNINYDINPSQNIDNFDDEYSGVDVQYNNKFLAPSPSISKTLNQISTKNRNVIMVENEPIFLNSSTTMLEIDIPPFYKKYEYENRVTELGLSDIANIVFQKELKDEIGPFESELEYVEKKNHFLKWYDYILYHAFGIDRIGFFQLDILRNEYLNSPWSYFSRKYPHTRNDIEACSLCSSNSISDSKLSDHANLSQSNNASQRSRLSSLRALFSWA